MISKDWRGQRLSDRLLTNKKIGDVTNFAEYQIDEHTLSDTAVNFYDA